MAVRELSDLELVIISDQYIVYRTWLVTFKLTTNYKRKTMFFRNKTEVSFRWIERLRKNKRGNVHPEVMLTYCDNILLTTKLIHPTHNPLLENVTIRQCLLSIKYLSYINLSNIRIIFCLYKSIMTSVVYGTRN